MVLGMTPSPTPHDDALLTLAFSLRANPGAYAILIGAGVSAPSGIFTAWGVVTDLISRVAHQLGAPEPEDPAEWYQERFGEPARYEALLEKLAPSPLERQRLLREYFEPADPESKAEDRRPTLAHRAIARLVKAGAIRVLVTLNFDRLLEQALRAEGIEPTIVTTPADVVGLAPLHTLECCVIHLHGDYLNPASMLNTRTELDAYHPQMMGLLQRILADYGLVIAGWSATFDPALMDAIKNNYPARYTLSWVEPNTPSSEATEFRQLMNGTLVPTDADTAFGLLIDAVTSFDRRQARHPLTVAVAADTAKRELSGRWVAIDLHDRLAAEFERLRLIQEFNLPGYQQDAPDGYVSMLERVEEASKVCVALVASLAYWGDERTDRWWMDELVRFSRQNQASGSVKLLRLRLISGSALFYTAGIGALASKRYDLLARLLVLTRPHHYSDDDQLLADVMEADRALENTAPRMHAFLAPLLVESLSLGQERVDDTWQLFEVIRISAVVIRNGRFKELASTFREANDVFIKSAETFRSAEQSGTGIEDARVVRATAFEDRGRALGNLAHLAPVHGAHLYAVDRYFDDERWQVPVAERLARELDAEGVAHPLAQAWTPADPGELSAAIRAVSAAAGRRAADLSWKGIGPGGGTIPSEIWLDSHQR
jgi:hypothetical protein